MVPAARCVPADEAAWKSGSATGMRRAPVSEIPRMMSPVWGNPPRPEARVIRKTTAAILNRLKLEGSQKMSRSVGDEIEIEMDSQRVLPVLIRKGGKRIGILYGADRRAVQGSVPAELLQDDVGESPVLLDSEVDHRAHRLSQIGLDGSGPVSRKDRAHVGQVPPVLEGCVIQQSSRPASSLSSRHRATSTAGEPCCGSGGSAPAGLDLPLLSRCLVLRV